MSRCTCETYGHCEPCRSEEGVVYIDDDFIGAVERVVRCVWCGVWQAKAKAIRVGKNVDDTWACGDQCPERPTPKDHNVVVTFRVRAGTPLGARKQVERMLSVVWRGKTNSPHDVRSWSIGDKRKEGE